MREIGAWLTLVTMGVILADVLTHPAGTKAAGSALNSTLTTSFTALLGNTPKS